MAGSKLGTSPICPVMIGRALHVQKLQLMAQNAKQGKAQVALIKGEAGIGKSRLVHEVLITWEESFQVLQGNCYELDRMRPYAPMIEILQTTYSRFPIEELAVLLSALNGAPTNSPTSQTHIPDQKYLLLSLTHVLIELAQTQPLAVVIEDVHWSDTSSLDCITWLVQHLNHHRIVLILTWRSDEMTPELVRCLASIERTRLGTEFHLLPLSLKELENMVNAIAGRNRTLRADVLEKLHHLTDGNPFFIEEIWQCLAVMDEIESIEAWDETLITQLNIPNTVLTSVQQRSSHLTLMAHQVLILASVLGNRVDFVLLKYLSQQDEMPLLQNLRELVTAQLLVEDGPDNFVFRHALTRQAIYTSLLARERRYYHQIIAQALTLVYPPDTYPHLLTDRAYHFYQAGLWKEALQFSMEAGQIAQRLHAPALALEHYTRALLSARHLNLLPPFSLHQARGQMYEMLGEFEAARGDYEQAVEIARRTQDISREAQGLLDLGFLWTASNYEKAGDYFKQAIILARNLTDTNLLANTLNRIGLWYTHANQLLEGLQHHTEALGIYREHENAFGVAETLDLLGVTAFMRGDMIAGWGYFAEAIDLCRKTDNRPRLAVNLLTASIRGGAFVVDTVVCLPVAVEQCMAECEEAIQIAQEIHLPATEAYAQIMLAHVLGWHGFIGQALSEAYQALALAQEIDHRMWIINAQTILGILHMEILDYTTAQNHLEQAMTHTTRMQSHYLMALVSSSLSRAYLYHNQIDRAEQLLSAIRPAELSTDILAHRFIWSAWAEFLLVSGYPAEALPIITHLIDSALNLNTRVIIPRLWYLQGRALAGLDRKREAETIWQTAYVAAREQHNLPMVWRIGLELGTLLAQGKATDSQRVKTLLANVHTTIDHIANALPTPALGKNFYKQATQQFPDFALPNQPHPPRARAGGLTRREEEVAHLVAQGMTNHHIAEILVISERTVEKHIENIMSKLYFNTRAQIAVWMVEHHPSDE